MIPFNFIQENFKNFDYWKALKIKRVNECQNKINLNM